MSISFVNCLSFTLFPWAWTIWPNLLAGIFLFHPYSFHPPSSTCSIQCIIIHPFSFHPPLSTFSIYNPLLSIHTHSIHPYLPAVYIDTIPYYPFILISSTFIHLQYTIHHYNPSTLIILQLQSIFIHPSHIHSIHPHPPAVYNPLFSIILFHSYILTLIHLQYKIHYYSTIIIPTNLIHIQYTIHYKSSFSSIYTHSPSLYCILQSIVIHPFFSYSLHILSSICSIPSIINMIPCFIRLLGANYGTKMYHLLSPSSHLQALNYCNNYIQKLPTI